MRVTLPGMRSLPSIWTTRLNTSIAVTRSMVKVGSMTCLNFWAYALFGVSKIRLNTGPVIRAWKSKYRRPMPSGICTARFVGSRLSLQ